MSCEFESHLLHEKAKIAEVAQLVEHNLAKVRVAGPSPVFRSQQKKEIQYRISFFYYISPQNNISYHLRPHMLIQAVHYSLTIHHQLLT